MGKVSVSNVYLNSVVAETLLEAAKNLHPKEMILLLRGSSVPDGITIEDLLVPPFATYGHGFASFPIHMLPVDFTVVGTAHSHPSGVAAPSLPDMNHMYGRVLLIVAYPYDDERNFAAFSRKGVRLPLRTRKSGAEHGLDKGAP